MNTSEQQAHPATDLHLISVILPCFNREASLKRAVQSVQKQSYTHWELLITDDGSTDGSLVLAESLAASDSRIRVFSNAHGGVSRARNTSLEHARGHMIAYLDSDNSWRTDYLSEVYNALGTAMKACCYQAMQLHIQDTSGETLASRKLFTGFDRDKLRRRNQIDLNTFAHTHDLYAMHGGFDEQLTRVCDWDLILRYTRHIDPIAIEHTGADYYHHADPQRVSLANEFKLNSLRVVLKAFSDSDHRLVLVGENGESNSDLDRCRSLGLPAHQLTKADFANFGLEPSDIVLWYACDSDLQGSGLQPVAQKLDYGCALSFYIFDAPQAALVEQFSAPEISDAFHYYVCADDEGKQGVVQSLTQQARSNSPNRQDRGFLRNSGDSGEANFSEVLLRIAGFHWPQQLSELSIAIGCQMLSTEDPMEWGDYAFANSLCKALQTCGANTRLLCRDEISAGAADADVLLYLFGINYPLLPRRSDQLRCLWVISHIDKLDPLYTAQFDLIFCASQRYAEELQAVSPTTRVHYLPQAADTGLFHPGKQKSEHDGSMSLCFVGNSRNATRPVVERADRSAHALKVWGRGWQGRLQPGVVQPGLLSSEEVAEVYRKATVVINDHWPDQLEWGIVNNRVFDALACATPVLSDANPGLDTLFPGLKTLQEEQDFDSALQQAKDSALLEQHRQIVINQHSFQHRAQKILAHIGRLLRKHHRHQLPCYQLPRLCFLVGNLEASSTRKRALELADTLQGHLPVSVVEQKDFSFEHIVGSDIIVLQRWTGQYGDKAQKLFDAIRALRPFGKQFIYDLDDLILHRANELPRRMVSACDAVSVSTVTLATQVKAWNSDVRLLPNGIDHKLFYTAAKPARAQGEDDQLVIICVSTDGAGYADVVALDQDLAQALPRAHRIDFVTLEEQLESTGAVNVIHGLGIEDLVQQLLSSDIALNIGEIPQRLADKLELSRYGIAAEDFLNCKSGLKFFYAALARLPFISTSTPLDYQLLLQDGVTAIIADDQQSRLRSILELAENPARRKELGDNAYQQVICKHAYISQWPVYLQHFLDLNAQRLLHNHQLVPMAQTGIAHLEQYQAGPALANRQQYTLQEAASLAHTQLQQRMKTHIKHSHELLFHKNRIKSLQHQKLDLQEQLKRIEKSHIERRREIQLLEGELQQRQERLDELNTGVIRFLVRARQSARFRLGRLRHLIRKH